MAVIARNPRSQRKTSQILRRAVEGDFVILILLERHGLPPDTDLTIWVMDLTASGVLASPEDLRTVVTELQAH